MAITQLDRTSPGATVAASRYAGVPVLLRSGDTAWLSPLSPGHRKPVLDVFDGMSDRSRYFRFMASTPRLTESFARQLAAVDSHRHVAIVASIGGAPVAIGRYIRTAADPSSADVALAVADVHQGRGLGTLLLAALGEVAADNAIVCFTYSVHPQNAACLALLNATGGELVLDDGDYVGAGPVPTGTLPESVAAQLRRMVARSAA